MVALRGVILAVACRDKISSTGTAQVVCCLRAGGTPNGGAKRDTLGNAAAAVFTRRGTTLALDEAELDEDDEDDEDAALEEPSDDVEPRRLAFLAFAFLAFAFFFFCVASLTSAMGVSSSPVRCRLARGDASSSSERSRFLLMSSSTIALSLSTSAFKASFSFCWLLLFLGGILALFCLEPLKVTLQHRCS